MTPALVVILLAFSSPLRQASMVTWNVLAPAFANQQKFPWASSQALSWSNRRERIVQQLSTIDADCICLQEVEVERWPELHAQLGELGYGGVLQETGGHPYGVAMLFKSDRLVCLRTESRSRAMIAVVQAAQAGAGAAGRGGGELLYLANVHLEAGPQKEQQRMLQLASLLKRVRFQAEQDGAMPHVDGALPLIIAGDFNCEPRSAPHRMLSQAPRHPEKRHGLCLRRALARMRPGLVALGPPECIPAGRPSQLGGGAWPHEPPSRCPEEGGAGARPPPPLPLGQPSSRLPSDDQERPAALEGGRRPGRKLPPASAALLPLRDAYAAHPPPWGPALRSTYRNGRVLDYIFASPPVDVLRTMPVSSSAGSRGPHRLPSELHPSDHIPIGAVLRWPGAPLAPTEQRSAWQSLQVEQVIARR